MPGKQSKGAFLLFEDLRCRDVDLTAEVEDLVGRLKIDPNAIDEEASEHSALFARWAVLAEEAAAYERYCKRDREIVVAEVAREVRQEFAKRGDKATEGRIGAEVELDERVIRASEALMAAQRDAGILNAIRQSLVHRREMIAELIRDRRHEWQAADHSV